LTEDPVMARISAAIATLHAGERERARECFAELWSELGENGDPFHVCTLAHFMADAQDDVHAELEWDLRALAAAERVSDGRAKAYHADLAIKSFFPSLHLNVGDACFRIGDLNRAREHAKAAEAKLNDLTDSPLSSMIRGGIARLSQRLASTSV
jgi:hypothetical protein